MFMRHIEIKRSRKEGAVAKMINLKYMQPSDSAKRHMRHNPYLAYRGNH